MSKFTDKDQGYKKMLKLLTSGKKPVVQVGILSEQASEQHEDSELTVGEIATYHEFGLGVPERSFIRSWADENKENAVAFLKKEVENAVRRGDDDFNMGLERLGLYCQSGIQKRISDGGPYKGGPLKKSTVDRKGSSVPLIDTGQLRSSISYKVEPDGEKK